MMEERIFGERGGRKTTRIPRDLPAAGLACGLSFLSDDAAQPGGSGQRRINSQKEAEAEEEADEKRRRTRAAVEEPGAMPCMYRYRCRHRGC